ncbi:MAG: hypothetical protein ACT4QA_20600 [Panacagrimonas sp.]
MNTRIAAAASLASVLMALGASAQAAGIDRELKITVDIQGEQSWRNVLQWSKAKTTQKYEWSTVLRSDGKLEGANLSDLDLDRRLAIKTEYLRRKGLEMIKAAGLDATSPDVQGDISDRMQKDSFKCAGDSVCISETGVKYAMLMAAATEPDNSALFEGEPRYQFFFGYPGCANRIRVVHATDTAGETGYGRKKDKIFPYALKVAADFPGTETDRKSMCRFFTGVIDTKDQKVYWDNIYVPTARGTLVRTEFEKTQTTDGEVAMPQEVMGWVNQTLRVAPLSGTASTTVPLNAPLDGNATVMGSFEGNAKVTMSWSFNPVAAPAAK